MKLVLVLSLFGLLLISGCIVDSEQIFCEKKLEGHGVDGVRCRGVVLHGELNCVCTFDSYCNQNNITLSDCLFRPRETIEFVYGELK